MNCPNCGTPSEGTSSTCSACGYAGLGGAGPAASPPGATAREGGAPSVPAERSAATWGSTQAAPRPTSDDGTTILVLALASLFVPILSVVAWVMGHGYQQRVDRGEALASANAHTGKVIGMVLTILYGLGLMMLLSTC